LASRYHPGEIEVQARAGVREMAARISDVIRPEIPLHARDFLEDQRMVVVGSTGVNGRVWASLLTGEPGFLRVIDERTLRIDASPVPSDPLDENLQPGMNVGLISIDLSSRRRMRLNGKAEWRPKGLYVDSEQVYGNCPKYIQAARTRERWRLNQHSARKRAARRDPYGRTASPHFLVGHVFRRQRPPGWPRRRLASRWSAWLRSVSGRGHVSLPRLLR
jgi:predicted pyridoxine 5'-phosphate oxidase superfamily flavin-nucleotide-binding protein